VWSPAGPLLGRYCIFINCLGRKAGQKGEEVGQREGSLLTGGDAGLLAGRPSLLWPSPLLRMPVLPLKVLGSRGLPLWSSVCHLLLFELNSRLPPDSLVCTGSQVIFFFNEK
jgi:hypothetical protein